MEKKPIIKIENLIKSFGTNNVLNGFSMELYKGEHLVIMGKSGSGKSVMIRCLVGLMVPDSGLIEIMGKNIENLNQVDLDNLRTEIGFLFQGSALYDSMTVRENLEFPLRKRPEKYKIKDQLVKEALENDEVSYSRYRSYVQIFEGEDEHYRTDNWDNE